VLDALVIRRIPIVHCSLGGGSRLLHDKWAVQHKERLRRNCRDASLGHGMILIREVKDLE
jgi:hypothetical protein